MAMPVAGPPRTASTTRQRDGAGSTDDGAEAPDAFGPEDRGLGRCSPEGCVWPNLRRLMNVKAVCASFNWTATDRSAPVRSDEPPGAVAGVRSAPICKMQSTISRCGETG